MSHKDGHAGIKPPKADKKPQDVHWFVYEGLCAVNDLRFFAIYIIGRNQTKYMEAKIMEKQSLPKLDIEGFTTTYPSGRSLYRSGNGTSQAAGNVSWRDRASRLMRGEGGTAREKPGNSPDGDVDPAYRKLLVKTGICAAVAIALLVISTAETPGGGGITDTLNQVVNHEFDIDKDIGRLKFVQTLDETEAVFSEQPGLLTAVYPADGDIVTGYGEAGSHGVRMEASGSVACIARGTVTAVGEIGDAGYIKTVLDTGETEVYYNVDPTVKVDDIVAAGQTVGEVEGGYLYLEMKDGEEYIDPIAFIEQKISGGAAVTAMKSLRLFGGRLKINLLLIPAVVLLFVLGRGDVLLYYVPPCFCTNGPMC